MMSHSKVSDMKSSVIGNTESFARKGYTTMQTNATHWFCTSWLDDSDSKTIFSFEERLKNLENVREAIYAIEKCPSTGKIHAHFYLVMKMQRKMLGTLTKTFGKGDYQQSYVRNWNGAVGYISYHGKPGRIAGPSFWPCTPEMLTRVKWAADHYVPTKEEKADSSASIDSPPKVTSDACEWLKRNETDEMKKLRKKWTELALDEVDVNKYENIVFDMKVHASVALEKRRADALEACKRASTYSQSQNTTPKR